MTGNGTGKTGLQVHTQPLAQCLNGYQIGPHECRVNQCALTDRNQQLDRLSINRRCQPLCAPLNMLPVQLTDVISQAIRQFEPLTGQYPVACQVGRRGNDIPEGRTQSIDITVLIL